MMTFDESKSSDPEMICGYFADFFKSVYLPDEPPDHSATPEDHRQGCPLVIELDTVMKFLE